MADQAPTIKDDPILGPMGEDLEASQVETPSKPKIDNSKSGPESDVATVTMGEKPNETKREVKEEILPPKPGDSTVKNLEKLAALLSTLRGEKDLRDRLAVILEPRNIQTSSNLSGSQVEAVVRAAWFYKTWPDIYEGLWTDAKELLGTMLSLKGYGIEKSISLAGAIEQSNILRAAFGSAGTSPASQEKKHWYNRRNKNADGTPTKP